MLSKLTSPSLPFFSVSNFCLLSLLLGAASVAAEPTFDEPSIEFFEKEVRPILTARCLECHGGGDKAPKGGLRMDARAELLKGGDTGAAIVPGKPTESLLVSAINYGDVYQMPPKSKLPAKEIATLTKWVEMGAPWPKEVATVGKVQPFDLAVRRDEHWCWQPIKDHAPPAVKDSAWPVTAVDRFLLAQLEAKSLKPAPQADKLVLLRRVYFDLVGLPPSMEEIDAFVKDESPQALERVVDRLLESVHFGERWGRHWLDLVRYAETRGHEFEPIIPNAWQYRDYVIRALNADVPYDRLLTEHIAGDLIEPRWRDDGETVSQDGRTPHPNPLPARPGRGDKAAEPGASVPQPSTLNLTPRINESVLGTGFWFLGEEVHSPVDIRKDETDRIDNRLDVLSKTFLGLTVACARCHDHKFDAISQRDYYALAGFALSGSYRQVRVDTEAQHREIAERLEELRANQRSVVLGSLVKEAKPTLDKLDVYLLAANRLVDEGIQTTDELEDPSPPTPLPAKPGRGEKEAATSDIVFANFEGDSWGEWKTEGTAFGEKPVRKADNIYEAPLAGFVGERFVNSHRNGPPANNNAGVRDAHIGKLISPTFRIERSSIRFLVGGGNHPTRTCINLIVDDKPVRTATGANSGQLRQEQWSVGDLQGKNARIEIVDAERGGWGHILVDQFVFTNAKLTSSNPEMKMRRLVAESRQRSDRLASEKQLDVELLARWTVELDAARADKKHPLHGLFQGSPVAPRQEAPNKDAAATAPSPTQSRLDSSSRLVSRSETATLENLVVDFVNLPEGRLLQDGVSFGMQPVPPGRFEMRGPADQRQFSVATVGGWERDLFWKEIKLAPGVEADNGTLGGWQRHGRMVRTPEFTLTKGTVWTLVRGSVRSYAAVNSHLIVVGPLHGALLREFKHDKPHEWHWVGHSLEGYRGHRLHLEFSPADDAECGIAMVVQQDSSPALPSTAWSWLDEFVKPDMPLEARAKSYREAISGAVTAVALDGLFSPPAESHRQAKTGWAEVGNWFVQHRELFVKDWQPPTLEPKDEAELAKTVQWESHLAPAMLEGNGVNEQLLIRGNSSTPKEPVPRRFLEACAGRDTGYGFDSGRKNLAYEMLRSPLVARVAVNRIWHHLFGRGIVPTVDNFGLLGQPPSHPELLDHLATQFVKEGWSQKRLIKSLILSRAYQMSSKPDPAAEVVDPNNVYWHRMPIKRLEGEAIRDSLLAVSGRLDRKPFGPSVAIHLTPFMQGRGRPGNSGPVDGDGRRSIYISVRRNFLSPMMLAFDTPSPFSTVGRRTISNVPAQALILMNDPLVIEQAKRWADRTLADSTQTAEQRIESLYLSAFTRRPTDREKLEAWSFLASYSGSPPDAKSDPNNAPREAWTDLCHVLFNVKEFIYVE